MNRIKQFDMSPEVAYRFATGELRIETKELLEEKFSQEMRTYFVLNADFQCVDAIAKRHYQQHKLREIAKNYFKVMAGESVLTDFDNSAEFVCNKIWNTNKNRPFENDERVFSTWGAKKAFQKIWQKQNILTDEETEIFLKSPKWAVKYAKLTKKRFAPIVEKRFIEGKELSKTASKTARTYVLEYCEMFRIILSNYNEILLEEGFGEKNNKKESEANKAYLKKIQEEKENCKTFLESIMKSNRLTEKDDISKLMECLV